MIRNKNELEFYPFVTIQLPIYNEPHVVERLIKSVCLIDYPLNKMEIQVLDDSTDETSVLLQKALLKYSNGRNIKILNRDNRDGFKAGALQNGLKTVKGEFVAIFDADFIPHIDFLKKTLPHFQNDKNIAFVQAKWNHLNADKNILTFLQAIILDGHFKFDQFARQISGKPVQFNGSCGVWRKTSLDEIGGWNGGSLAEDMDASLRADFKGFKGIFLDEPLAGSELPQNFKAYKNQQFRWNKGKTQNLVKFAGPIIKSRKSVVWKFDRLFYLSESFSYPALLIIALLNLPILLFYSSLLEWGILLTILPAFLLTFIISFLSFTLSDTSSFLKKSLTFPMYMSGGIAISLSSTIAVFQALFKIDTPFVRTPKTGNASQKYKNSYKPEFRLTWDFLLFIYYAVGIYICIDRSDFIALFFYLIFLAGFGSAALSNLYERLSLTFLRQKQN